MNAAWKPGDVAIRSYLGVEQVSLFVKCHGHRTVDAHHWHHDHGGFDADHGDHGPDYPNYRPLVVIDPEDRKQVGRLVRLFWGNGTDDCDDPVAMQAALREFADPKPPKPAEPTGLGAVVETQPMIVNEDGDTASVLIRHADGLWWTNGEGGWYWADVPAVRVLSEGVTA